MNKERKPGAQIVVGAQYGDEGKGLISAYLSQRENACIVAKAGVGPNAEHGFFLSEKGPYIKVNQLPLGWILTPTSQVRIGPGVAVNPRSLLGEIEKFDLEDRVRVDYRCPIITEEHIEKERKSKGMVAIGSTFSGSGFCRSDFVLRRAQQARDIKELHPFLTDVSKEINEVAQKEVVVVESSQGTFLSLAFSPDYPNVTSDNVTTMAAADDVGLNWKRLSEVILVVKTMPTREGAGSLGLGTKELTPEEIRKRGLVEYSSIGGVLRRKGESINWEMLAYAVELNGPTQVAVTFCEHYDPQVKNLKERNGITDKVWKLIEKVQSETGVPVTLLNTGKPFDCIIDLTQKGIDWEKVKGETKLPL